MSSAIPGLDLMLLERSVFQLIEERKGVLEDNVGLIRDIQVHGKLLFSCDDLRAPCSSVTTSLNPSFNSLISDMSGSFFGSLEDADVEPLLPLDSSSSIDGLAANVQVSSSVAQQILANAFVQEAGH